MTYRSDIDGLRGIAVLVVLLFHCGFETFSGGFVGVDVFFVISGFLITSIVLDDLESGRFSFSSFYIRRTRRLLPALFVTVLLTLLVAAIVMAPEDLVDTATAGALATVSLSNFYFAMGSSYFDISAHSKPFLHMWSLSLEEQFYLFWPACLYLACRLKWQRAIPALVVAGAVGGLALSQYWVGRNPDQAYFLLPFRGFQFLIGAACIPLSRLQITSKLASGALLLSGLAIIFCSATLFSESTRYPGIAALVPSIGAALVIWQGQHRWAGLSLGARPMVWLGRISYSVYLVHWPIVVFWLYLNNEPLSLTDKFVLLMLSIVAGYALHELVERRFRRPQASGWKEAKPFLASMAASVVVVGFFCGAVVATRGLPDRLDLVPRIAEYRDESVFPFLRNYSDGQLRVGSGGAPRVLIFGDSMVQNYVPAIMRVDGMRDADVEIVTRGGCVLAMGAVLVNSGSPDRDCLGLRDRLYTLKGQFDLIIWAQNWLGYGNSLNWEGADGKRTAAFSGATSFEGWRPGVERTLEHFSSLGKNLVVIGPPVVVDNVSPVLRHIGPLTDIVQVSMQFPLMRERSESDRDLLSVALRDLVSDRPHVLYIDPRSIICSDQACQFSNGKFSYYLDSLHNTAAATGLLTAGLERAGLGVPPRALTER